MRTSARLIDCPIYRHLIVCGVRSRARRQIFSDIVFAEKNFVDANFSKEGFEYYLRLRAQMLALLPTPHIVLYLDVSPEECYSRIHQLRKRVRCSVPVTARHHAQWAHTHTCLFALRTWRRGFSRPWCSHSLPHATPTRLDCPAVAVRAH